MIDAAPEDTIEFSPGWYVWLAKNRMLGLPDDQLVEVMADHGLSRSDAWAEIARLNTDPSFQAGRWVGERLRKLESIMTIQEQLRDLAPSARSIDRRRDLSEAEFLANYYAENRPVVLLDFVDTWLAREWTVDSLEKVLGDEPIEVMIGRQDDEQYEVNAALHRATMPFNEYVTRVRDAGRSNDIYLVANNHLLDRPAAAPLWQDFDAGSPPLDSATTLGHAFLWFGPAGTVTPLHHDVMNVLFVQLRGIKRFTLVAPAYTPRVYNEIGVHASVDIDKPDYLAFPAFRGVPTTSIFLKPGETLFLPVGWWHRVESLDISISLSFTNFLHTNQFRWQHPSG